MNPVAQKAKALTEAGYAVFPVRGKIPTTENGLKDATLDPYWAEEWFEKTRADNIAIHTGMSGLVVLDIDYHPATDDKPAVDGYESLEYAWLDTPESFSYTSVGGHGKHILYRAPEGANFNGTGRYRGLMGVDRRAGESYIVFNSDTIPDRKSLALAPEWLCDESRVRSADKFEGTLKDWYESLEPGEPNLLVRRAMSDIEDRYHNAGNDFDHAALIESQFRAIRLGAEGNPGSEALLALIEELFMAREGDHSRPESEWTHEFLEGLVSGIEKYGAAIELRKNLPAYSLAVVPASVPDRLVSGDAGDKEVFRELLRALQESTDDDMLVTSVLWNSPRTKDLSREWGLEFVHARVTDARSKPEPVRENPTLEPAKIDIPATQLSKTPGIGHSFLSAPEIERVKAIRTFIDEYLAASASKGFHNTTYDIPAAWTALSMAFGGKAFIPKGVNIGMNLWFLGLGYSGTGKTASDDFLTDVLDTMLKDGEGYYNLGAHSSPEGLHEALLERDGQASIIHHDEASDFFGDLKRKDWMASLKDLFSKWYVGRVDPMTKVRLKELKGKSARTSFNIHMLATPDRLTGLLDTDMFASGFLARFNWVWAAPPEESDARYESTLSQSDEVHHVNPTVFKLSGTLAILHSEIDVPVVVGATKKAMARLKKGFKVLDTFARGHERYDILEPAITRLGREGLWKLGALTALYDGRGVITEDDVLVALYYSEEWFHTLFRVVESTSDNEFSRALNEIEAFVRAQGGSASSARLLHRFRSMIKFGPREIEDRLGYLVSSGRLNRVDRDGRVIYELNGSE